jgi:MFS family permease
MSTPAVLLKPLQKEFGWSTATISVALSARMAVFGLMAPFAAAFMRRFGLRKVMTTSAIIVPLGMAASAAVDVPWQLTVLWGLVVGGGTGLTALVLGATVANRWFISRRGLVIGVMTASSATGQLPFLPAYAAIDDAFRWRAVLYTVAAVSSSVACDCSAFGPRHRRDACRRTTGGLQAGGRLQQAGGPLAGRDLLVVE